MPSSAARTFHYIRSWVTGRDDLEARDLVLERDGTPVPATLLLPRRVKAPLPAWVVLHGITRPGREHAQLVRFTRAVSAGGCAVLIPEVPEWRELNLAPTLTVPTVAASVRFLRSRDDIDADHVGLVGFSFGAPQALAASGTPELRGRLKGVVAFGGYCDLERTIRFQLTGRHEWQGERWRLRPDPYGRWIVAGNYLTGIPGLEDAAPVAEALRHIAARAGDLGIMSWDGVLEATKVELRAGLSAGRHRELFDLFCPPSETDPDGPEAERMAHELAAAARRAEPTIEPAPLLRDVPGPIHLLHGRHDHLIPFTEMFRLRMALSDRVPIHDTVTPLFGHSARDPFPGLWEGARETVRFVRSLSRLLGVV